MFGVCTDDDLYRIYDRQIYLEIIFRRRYLVNKKKITYHDSLIHGVVCTTGFILLGTSTVLCMGHSAYLICDWFYDPNGVNLFMLPLYVLLWMIMSGFMMSFCIIVILFVLFLMDEYYERKWINKYGEYHERSRLDDEHRT